MAKTRSLVRESKGNETKTEETPASRFRCRVVATRIRPTTIGNSVDADKNKQLARSKPALGLIWKTKRGRRETAVLVRFLDSDGNRQPKDYARTIDELKRKAKKRGCCTCLTDSLEILEIDGSTKPTAVWWNQMFESDGESDTMNHDQLLYFGSGTGEAKQDVYFSCRMGKDTDWSLFLHRINNCNAVGEIVQTGAIPVGCPSKRPAMPSPNNSHKNIDATTINTDLATIESAPSDPFLSTQYIQPEKFLLNNSMAVLHFRELKSADLSSIAGVRFVRTLCAVRKDSSVWNTTATRGIGIHHCDLCSKPSLIPFETNLSKEKVDRWNAFLSEFFDMVLGLVACTVLLFLFRNNHRNLAQTIYLDAKQNIFQSLENQIEWLETFPAGFKLNVNLTHNMGHGIRSLLRHQKSFLVATLWDPHGFREYLISLLATLAALGGWSAFLAVLMDLWRLEILHVTLLAICFRKLYQAELYLLSSLFRLFRGKKRNALRHRTDSMQYDSMQLLLGTIAFCICVFLWTTAFVYYTFFVIWNLLMQLPLMACSILYLLSRSIPMGTTFFRFANPHWFPKDLYITMQGETEIDSNGKNIQVSYFGSILESPVKLVFQEISCPLKRLFQWYLVSFLELLYPRASHTSHSCLPLTLLTDTSDPRG